MEYGYARVSSTEQNLDRQILALKEFVSEENIVVDKASGKNTECEGYQALNNEKKIFGNAEYAVNILARACLKKTFCKMCVTICGRFCSDEGVVAGYDNRIRAKSPTKWGVQIAGMIFQTRSRNRNLPSPYNRPVYAGGVVLSNFPLALSGVITLYAECEDFTTYDEDYAVFD